MNRLRIISAFVFAIGLIRFAFGETMASKALEKLGKNAPVHADSFDFVVMGDSRSAEPVIMPEALRQSIREWNVLKPAFVMDDGDLILGGSVDGLSPQWLEFEKTIAKCEMPFVPVVGNHDVSDPATEQMFEQRIGPLKFSFNYGNSQFIVLNTEEQGQVDTFSDAQLAWLKAQLEGSKATNIFLFMHKPYFAEHWDRSWAKVAEVLKGHPVKVVFGSHEHLYRYVGEREGVRYVVTGGGGADIHTPENEGGFYHYLYVKVRGGDVTWAVIRPGSVLPEDAITKERIDEIHSLQDGMFTDAVEAPYGQNVSRDVAWHVKNPYGRELASSLTWTVPRGWHVKPEKAEYKVSAKGEAAVTFQVSADGPDAVRFPAPTFTTTVEKVDHGGPITVTKRLDLIPRIFVPYAPGPVTIDGKLDEWKAAPVLPMIYAYDFDIKDTKDLQSQVRLMWGAKYLYMAIETEDDEFFQPYGGDIVWSADGVQLFLDHWEWGLTLTTKGEEVFLYKGPGRDDEKVNTVVKLAVHRDGRHTVYEAAFPASEVAPMELKAGGSCRFSIVANDLDPSVKERPRHWAELTPGAGSGDEDYPRVKVVLGGTVKK